MDWRIFITTDGLGKLMSDNKKSVPDSHIPARNHSLEKANQSLNRLSKAFLLLGFAFLAVVVKLWTDDVVVRLVPPGMTAEATVGKRSADSAYLQSFGLYVSTLSANITPKNAAFVADQLSSVVDPEVYPAIRRQILAYAHDPQMQQTGAATRFDASAVAYEPETQKVFVSGNFQIISSYSIGRVEPVVYEMKVAIKNGRPWVMGIDHYPGSEPHTLKWLENHPPAPANRDETKVN